MTEPSPKHPVSARVERASWLAVVALAVGYVAFYAPFMLNVPLGDDLISIVPFVGHWRESSGADRFSSLFEQYFNHRIALTRATAAGVDFFAGHLNLVVLQTLGLLLWLAVAVAAVAVCARRAGSVWLALPVAILLLQPGSTTNVTVAMQGVSNHGILVLAATVAMLAAGDSWVGFSAAVALSVVAVFTAANGLLLLPLFAVVAALQGQSRRALTVAALAAVVTALYFFGFIKDPTAPFSPTDFATNAFTMLGAPFWIGRSPMALTQGIGAALLLAFLAGLWRQRSRVAREPIAFLGVFLFGSVAMAAYGRIGWGAQYMLQDRYTPYGLLIAAAAWTLAMPSRPRPLVFGLVLVGTAGVNATSYAVAYPRLIEERRTAVASVINEQLGETFVRQEWGRNAAVQRRAIAAGIIRPSAPSTEAPSAAEIRRLVALPVPTGLAIPFLVAPDDARAAYVIRPTTKIVPASEPFCLLAIGDRTLLLPGTARRRTYLNILSHFSILTERDSSYIWLALRPPRQPARLIGLARSPDGQWSVAWHGTISSR